MTAPKYKRLAPETRASELVQAGLRVLSRGGITAFTIDNICKASGASRGLVGHYFGSKDGLLAACYAAAYAPLMQAVSGADAPLTLTGLIDELLSDRHLRPEGLTIWLALWGEIAVNPVLRAEHLRHYRTYRAAIAQAAARHAGRDRPDATDDTLAAALIALLDGIWLESSIAPGEMDPDRARAAVNLLLQGAGLTIG
jgi:TetR/AcrR family transcriptional regulator, transcriptional repressor of bet genes